MFKKPTRHVSRVFIHCSATDNPSHDNKATINDWHLARGWSGIGYHYFIQKDGTLEYGRSLEKKPAAQAPHNTATIAICLSGLDIDKFTDQQRETLFALCREIATAYNGKVSFHGHREVANKTCPVIDYKKWLDLDKNGHITKERPSWRKSVKLPSFRPSSVVRPRPMQLQQSQKPRQSTSAPSRQQPLLSLLQRLVSWLRGV